MNHFVLLANINIKYWQKSIVICIKYINKINGWIKAIIINFKTIWVHFATQFVFITNDVMTLNSYFFVSKTYLYLHSIHQHHVNSLKLTLKNFITLASKEVSLFISMSVDRLLYKKQRKQVQKYCLRKC